VGKFPLTYYCRLIDGDSALETKGTKRDGFDRAAAAGTNPNPSHGVEWNYCMGPSTCPSFRPMPDCHFFGRYNVPVFSLELFNFLMQSHYRPPIILKSSFLPHLSSATHGVPHSIAPRDSSDVGLALESGVFWHPTCRSRCHQRFRISRRSRVSPHRCSTARIITLWASVASISVLAPPGSARYYPWSPRSWGDDVALPLVQRGRIFGSQARRTLLSR
jgi:hypothetical protein